MDKFVQRNQYLPDEVSAGVYAACQLLQQSVEGTGTTENETLHSYLLDNEFDTVFGTYQFQENGVPLSHHLLFQCIDGELQVIHPEPERTAKAMIAG